MTPPNSLEEPSDFWDSLFNQPLLSGDLGGTRLTIGFGQSSTTPGAEELEGREGGKSEGLDGGWGSFPWHTGSALSWSLRTPPISSHLSLGPLYPLAHLF